MLYNASGDPLSLGLSFSSHLVFGSRSAFLSESTLHSFSSRRQATQFNGFHVLPAERRQLSLRICLRIRHIILPNPKRLLMRSRLTVLACFQIADHLPSPSPPPCKTHVHTQPGPKGSPTAAIHGGKHYPRKKGTYLVANVPQAATIFHHASS